MASDPASTAKQQIENLESPDIEELPFSYFEKPSNKTTRLIANSNNQGPVEGQNRWYEYSFNEPVFIQSISIEHDNYSDNSEFHFELIDFNNKVRTFAEKSASDETYVIVNTFAKSLKFKPPKDYFFSNRTIRSVHVFGFNLSKAGEFISWARRIDKVKESAIKAIGDRETTYAKKISEAELAVSKIAEATKELQALKGQSQRQRSAIKNLEIARNDLTAKVESMR